MKNIEMTERFVIKTLADFKLLEKHLTHQWLHLETHPNAFRYKLNVQKQKTLDGRMNFLVQLNAERSSLRRAPQNITSVVQPFNQHVFNFNKAQECETLLQCDDQLMSNPSKSCIATFLINNSPLTKYHSLICPRLNENLPQILTKESCELAINIITGLNDRSYRIGYNSLGAFASVNHLHLHLLHVPEKLFVEDAEIKRIAGDIYRLDWPAFAFCLPVFRSTDTEKIAQKLVTIIEYFCAMSIPHNIFWTWATHSGQQLVKIFIFPRHRLSDKTQKTFNIAFCELAGYVPVGDSNVYESLTEDFMIDQIAAAMGPVDRDDLILQIVQLLSNE